MRAQHLRVARPSGDLAAVVAFYRDALGFEQIAAFEDHAGFDGVMLGHPDQPYHLEFTREHGAHAGRAPSPEHLLVFYLRPEEWDVALARLARAGIVPVAAHNPYWDRHGISVEDPDGYRIVLHRGRWQEPPDDGRPDTDEVRPHRAFNLSPASLG